MIQLNDEGGEETTVEPEISRGLWEYVYGLWLCLELKGKPKQVF